MSVVRDSEELDVPARSLLSVFNIFNVAKTKAEALNNIQIARRQTLENGKTFFYVFGKMK